MIKCPFKAVWVSFTVLIFAVFMLSACSDDDSTVIPPQEEGFAIEFLVVDLQGDPVEGIQLTLFNDHDYLQGKDGSRAAVQIPFSLEARAEVMLYITDVEGDTVQTVVHGVLMEGMHGVIWTGRNEEGIPQNSGRYNAQLRIYSDDGSVVYAHSMGILLSQPDSDFFVGTTDAEGRILLEDKRLFPQLYELSDMYATDENGALQASFNVNTTMHAYFKDPAVGGLLMREVLEIGATTIQITQVWDESKTIDSMKDLTGTNLKENSKTMAKSASLDEIPNSLRYPYPNPFN